jgi:hypothetical protein
MDDDPDDDPTAEFPAVTEDDEEDGPACGTAAAATHFHLTYNDATGLRFVEEFCCCFRHVPRPADVLPEGAELVEIVLEDAWARTVVRDGQAEVTSYDSETVLVPVAFVPVRPC